MNLLSPRGEWILKNCRGPKILDVGFAGSDETPDWLFQELRKIFGVRNVIGIDSNAAKILALKKINTLVADGRNLPFKNNNIDTVVLAEVIEHQRDFFSFFQEAFRVLKKDGLFLLTTPNPYGMFRWLKHYFFSPNITSRTNVTTFLGFHDHKMFFEPLSVVNLLYDAGFATVVFQTTNPSFPYLPNRLRDPNINIWPFNRLGTYACYKAIK